MASKALELTLISAKDLQNVNLFSRMEVYVVASIDGDPRTQQRTPADCDGGRSPSWNHSLRLPLPSGDPSRHSLRLILRTERALGDRDVGEAHIPLKEIILDGAVSSGSPRFLSYQVRKPSSGKAKGTINLSYKITDSIAVAPAAHPAYTAYPAAAAAAYPPPVKASKADEHVTAYPAAAYPPPAKPSKADEHVTAYPPAIYPPAAKTSNADVPVTAYPAGPSAASAAYPAAVPYAHPAGYSAYTPPQQYGYAPPTAGYGYGYAAQPPPQAGYGYGYAAQPQPQPQKKKNKFGMGLGAGLLGGALGGLLIGDMVSDVADYDAGYDAGFDDAGGGFDF